MNPPKITKLIGYARVSTDDQNLSLQIEALQRAGVHIDDIYTDKKSGADIDRPGFQDMWKDLRPGDTLVIWKLDRLGRNLSQLLQTAEKIDKRGAQLRVITEVIDTTTPMGRFMFNVMGSFAQLEREMGVERTKAGLAAAREKGRIGGAKRMIPKAKVAEARALIEGGMSVRDAAKAIGAEYPTLYKWLRLDRPQGASDLEE